MYELEGRLFDWDKKKNLTNLEKHGVSFKAAATAFFDTNAMTREDYEHSQCEDRFVLIGFSKEYDLLTVCHCYRGDGSITRIISAREATEKERGFYEYGENGRQNRP